VSPAPTDAALARFYATYAASHRTGTLDQQRTHARAHAPEESLILTQLRSAVRLDGAKALDVGCGLGVFADLLARCGARAHGVDLDPDSVAFAREHLGLGDVRVGTIFDVSERDFDVVTMLDFIEHPLDVMPTLTRACELLRSRGVLALWTPAAYRFDADEAPVALRVDLEHMQYLSCDSVVEIARRLDLSILHLETCGEADLGVARPTQAPTLARKVRAALASGLHSLERQTGLGVVRAQLRRPRPFAERHGNYCLMALLAKR
jgi:SAM-dependent methyltransferase